MYPVSLGTWYGVHVSDGKHSDNRVGTCHANEYSMAVRTASRLQPRLGRRLLRDSGLKAFFWTQFLGALHGNVYKMLVSLLVAFFQIKQQFGPSSLVYAGTAFGLVFLLCFGPAGELADRFHKIRGNS